MDNDKYFEEQADQIIPKLQPVDTKNFWQRNKKLLIVIILLLIALYVGVTLYVYFVLPKAIHQINNIQK